MKGLIVIALLALASPAAAQPAGAIANGKKVYDAWCGSCHAAGIGNPGLKFKPGVDALLTKYNGEKPGLLTDRTDLTPEVVAFFVRNGVSIMPFFRRTEISDAELKDLGAYLSQKNKAR